MVPTYTPASEFDASNQGFDESLFEMNILTDAPSFNIVDSLVKSGDKAVEEAFSIVDSWLARFRLAEAFSIADSLVKSGVEQLAEAVSVADSLVKSGDKAVAEAVKVIDSVVKKHVITMMIRKIIIRVRGGSYESDIELED